MPLYDISSTGPGVKVVQGYPQYSMGGAVVGSFFSEKTFSTVDMVRLVDTIDKRRRFVIDELYHAIDFEGKPLWPACKDDCGCQFVKNCPPPSIIRGERELDLKTCKRWWCTFFWLTNSIRRIHSGGYQPRRL